MINFSLRLQFEGDIYFLVYFPSSKRIEPVYSLIKTSTSILYCENYFALSRRKTVPISREIMELVWTKPTNTLFHVKVEEHCQRHKQKQFWKSFEIRFPGNDCSEEKTG